MPHHDNNHKKIEASGLLCLPEALVLLLDACDQGDIDCMAAAAAAALDPGLTARLLDAVFTASDFRPQKFPTLADALIRLGQGAVRTLAVHAAVDHLFAAGAGLNNAEGKCGESTAFDSYHFWRKAVRGAHLAQLLARQTGYGNSQEAYFAGLLRDIGQPVMFARHPQEYNAILKEVNAVSELMLAEKNRFGATHLEVAEQLVRGWRITSFLPDAIIYQHHSLESVQGAHPLVKIMNLSAHLANRSGKLSDPQFDHAKSLFGLNRGDLSELTREADEAVDKAARELRLAVPGKRDGQLSPTPYAGLARHMRTFTLLSSAAQSSRASSMQDAALAALAEQLRVAFGFSTPLVFLFDSAANCLQGHVLPGQAELIGQFEIPLRHGRSLAGDCWQTQQIVHSFNANMHGRRSVTDEQICRLAGAAGMLCLPLVKRDAAVGVAIVGIDEADLARIETEQQTLLAFAAQAAWSITSTGAGAIDGDGANAIAISQLRLRKVIHEVNNPLGIMKNYVKILRLKMGKEDPAQFGLAVIDEEIDRVTRIIGSLFQAAEPITAAGEPVNVNLLIFDLARITNESLVIRDNIRLKTELDHAVKPLRCDKGKLKQVLVNLVKNAAEALHEGGEIVVSSHNEVAFDDEKYVEIAVADNGPGLPQEVLDHLFEPVASTKGDAHFGLGLSIVQGLVQELSGIIRCKSDNKNGTRFQILLPSTLSVA